MNEKAIKPVPVSKWKPGQRVIVFLVGSHGNRTPLREPKPGTVQRILIRDTDEAFVRLDERLCGDEERFHHFSEGDRRLNVPTDRFACELAE